MVSEASKAYKAFLAGVLSMGITVDGQSAPVDHKYASLAFQRASEWDPSMADAWLGRVAMGDRSVDTFEHLFEVSSKTLGRELRRLGLNTNDLSARFVAGLYIEHPLSTRTDVACALAVARIDEGRFDDAVEVLREAESLQSSEATQGNTGRMLVPYLRGVLYFRTQRWPDVLSALAGSKEWEQDYMRAGADVMVGTACVQLGLFGEGIERLTDAEDGPIPAARIAAKFTRGLALREQGKEDEAVKLFEVVYSEQPGFEANAKALKEPRFRMAVTTPEAIARRTDRWDPASTPTEEELRKERGRERGASILEEAEKALSKQIGLGAVKEQVAKLQSAATLARVRSERGLTTAARSNHLVFTGPPGTGKTTIARIVAKIYCGLGILATDNVVEATRQDLVGQHLGSTAIKTNKLIDEAMDGVLFIDEAYTLIQSGLSGGDAFGREAVDTLLARMENDRERLVVIVAGYEMEIDRFLASNEGLSSRFSKRIRFQSYTPDELAQIAKVIASSRDSDLSDEALDAIHAACLPLHEDSRTDESGNVRRAIDAAGNGRFIRNLVEAAEEEREHRLSSAAGVDLTTLDEDDLRRIESADMKIAIDTVMAALQ